MRLTLVIALSTVIALPVTVRAQENEPAATQGAPAPAPQGNAGDVSSNPPPPPPKGAESLPPPTEALPPDKPLTKEEMVSKLSPYGRWENTPEYGRVWVPSNVPPDWQPYTDGRWSYTNYGWSFAATVPWGLTFHYGRWAHGPSLGWYWVPGYTWGPGYVAWNVSGDYVSWAPYGPYGYGYGLGWYGWAGLPYGYLGYPIHDHYRGHYYGYGHGYRGHGYGYGGHGYGYAGHRYNSGWRGGHGPTGWHGSRGGGRVGGYGGHGYAGHGGFSGGHGGGHGGGGHGRH